MVRSTVKRREPCPPTFPIRGGRDLGVSGKLGWGASAPQFLPAVFSVVQAPVLGSRGAP